MNGDEEPTRQLAHRLLSVWHWSSAVDPPTYPPVPTSMNIGYWLRESNDEDERQIWIEAYACALQCMAEASVGQRWIAYRGIRVPKISRLVEIFLHATGTLVSPDIIHQCWPAWHDETPVQNLDGIRWNIILKLDEIAMRCTSPIAWDQFVHSPKWIRNVGEKKLCATVLGKHSMSECACLASD